MPHPYEHRCHDWQPQFDQPYQWSFGCGYKQSIPFCIFSQQRYAKTAFRIHLYFVTLSVSLSKVEILFPAILDLQMVTRVLVALAQIRYETLRKL